MTPIHEIPTPDLAVPYAAPRCEDFCNVNPHPECQGENATQTCVCKQAVDQTFCETCVPNCGDCNAFCEVAEIPECKGQGGIDSCACKQALDPGFCHTCPSAGGAGCGDCEGFCAELGGVSMVELHRQDPCETDGASCECFAHRDPNFCSLTVPAQCSDFCGVATEPGPSECEPPNEASCECKAVMDPAFCGTCPNCGGCDDFCNVSPHPECQGENATETCECKQAVDPNFCETCVPNCGDCNAFCEVADIPECKGQGVDSCACKLALDSGFCNTCAGAGGEDCGDCEGFCAELGGFEYGVSP